jgi:hypothetical protein
MLCEKIAQFGPVYTKQYGDYLNKIQVKSHVSLVPEVKVAKLIKTFTDPAMFLESDINGDHILKASRGSGFILDLATVKTAAQVHTILRDWTARLTGKGLPCEFLIEEKITDAVYGKTGTAVDYKFFCFHGKPHFFLCRDGMDNRNFYYIDYRPLKLTGKQLPRIDLTPMIRVAETLSAPFPFVRIDLYNGVDGVYFGEYTFHVNAGKQEFDVATERALGALW